MDFKTRSGCIPGSNHVTIIFLLSESFRLLLYDYKIIYRDTYTCSMSYFASDIYLHAPVLENLHDKPSLNADKIWITNIKIAVLKMSKIKIRLLFLIKIPLWDRLMCFWSTFSFWVQWRINYVSYAIFHLWNFNFSFPFPLTSTSIWKFCTGSYHIN